MTVKAVIGLGFGDEGKGQTVHALAAKAASQPLVVRFSGGQQAGHTVTLPDGRRHVFSNFGSGTLVGSPTYWSEFCTVDPAAILRELAALREDFPEVEPKLYINYRCPVTTPIEILNNDVDPRYQNNGTCGCGVGKTWAREEDLHFNLDCRDLHFMDVRRRKLKLIAQHTFQRSYLSDERLGQVDDILFEWDSAVDELLESACVEFVERMPEYPDIIFEGSQGLLLDERIGFFPHVTRSRTGTHNIRELVGYMNIQHYLVTRAYQTRHGRGPMTNRDIPFRPNNTDDETNRDDGVQGPFRASVLDADLLRYGLEKDAVLRDTRQRHTMVMTCLDQIDGDDYRFTGRRNLLRERRTARQFCDAVVAELECSHLWACERPDFLHP